MATKSISTVEKIMSGSVLTGLIMQDESGFFYRPKGVNGLHKPGKDGDHYPTAKEAKAAQGPGASVPPGKPGQDKPQGKQSAPGKPLGASQAPAKVDKAPTAAHAAHKAASGLVKPLAGKADDKEPNKPQAAHHLTAKAGQEEADKLLQLSQEVAEHKVASAAPGSASKVRYKVVEASGPVGLHFWLYAGYEHTKGFKWNGSGGFMFLNMEAVENFLRANGIGGTIEVETVDVTNGSYDPNKGVTPHDEPNGQRRLI